LGVRSAGESLEIAGYTELLCAGTGRAIEAVVRQVAAQVLEDATRTGTERLSICADRFRHAFRPRTNARETVGFAPGANPEWDDANATAGTIVIALAFLTVTGAGGAQKLSVRRLSHNRHEAEN
jgi:hypothetical protein